MASTESESTEFNYQSGDEGAGLQSSRMVGMPNDAESEHGRADASAAPRLHEEESDAPDCAESCDEREEIEDGVVNEPDCVEACVDADDEGFVEAFDDEDVLDEDDEFEGDEFEDEEYDDDEWDQDEEEDEDDSGDAEELESPEAFEDDEVFEQLDTLEPAPTMAEILMRQDDVNNQLDDLNDRIETLIAELTGKDKKPESNPAADIEIPLRRAA